MFEILTIIELWLTVTAIALILDLNSNIKELNKQASAQKTAEKRTHPVISKAKFDNVLSGRTNVYDKYKNKDGLYEPVKTANGIEIKRKGE